MQQSVDSADTSGASGSADSDSTSKSFKSIWKKAIRKLNPRRSRSTDDSKLSSTSTSTNINAGYLTVAFCSDLILSWLEVLRSTQPPILGGKGSYCMIYKPSVMTARWVD